MPDSKDIPSFSCFGAAVATLLQGEVFLGTLTDADYGRLVPRVFNASIGGHYRHVLDHFQIVLEARSEGVVRYHNRERDRALETSVQRALKRTRELVRDYCRVDSGTDGETIEVQDTLSADPDSPAQRCSSSLARETVYAVHHAVHHFALIRVMGESMGLRFPEGFGVAPSTRRHQRGLEGAEHNSGK